ncbi:MAG: complex I NDUFA9 subunit family protein [Pseudomonadota bacterium]
MTATPGVATVFGGSGFVGRYITWRLAQDGWRIRVAVRRPNEALFVKGYGDVGQVEPILANIRDEASAEAAIKGSSLVINCVGILTETSKQRFDQVHGEAAGRIARLSEKHGVNRFIHLSAIGANLRSDSDYARSKGEGERLVLKHMKSSVIFRPSVVFGPEDQFFNRFAGMTGISPALPLVGADTKFQPVYVDDIALAVQKAARGDVKPNIYELGGPESMTFRDLMDMMLNIIDRKRLIVSLPLFAAKTMAFGFSALEAISLGLFHNELITADQIKQLQRDNVVGTSAKSFSDLGITPTAMGAVLPEYLYMYRPQGQYTEMTKAAKTRTKTGQM